MEKIIEEVTEIMDEEESIFSKSMEKIVAGSMLLQGLIMGHTQPIRTRIRANIREYIKNKAAFDFYIEMRSFNTLGTTKVGMFKIGDGNTATDPELSKFIYTIPHIFTEAALCEFLKTIINITGIREYNTVTPGHMPFVRASTNIANNTTFSGVHIGRLGYQWKRRKTETND